jgi:hypothetical protein
MLKRGLLAGMVAMVGWTAQAEHAIAPEINGPPVFTREICTTVGWGYGGARTDCRYQVLAVQKPKEALKGICTTYYGRRTCY